MCQRKLMQRRNKKYLVYGINALILISCCFAKYFSKKTSLSNHYDAVLLLNSSGLFLVAILFNSKWTHCVWASAMANTFMRFICMWSHLNIIGKCYIPVFKKNYHSEGELPESESHDWINCVWHWQSKLPLCDVNHTPRCRTGWPLTLNKITQCILLLMTSAWHKLTAKSMLLTPLPSGSEVLSLTSSGQWHVSESDR